MKRPSDIPQDVWDRATEYALGMLGQTQSCGCESCVETATLSHARAIHAERERCAGEADNLHALEFANSPYREGYYTALDTVAAAIRKRAQ